MIAQGAAAAPAEGLLKGMLANNAQQQRKQEAMRTFHEKVEYVTAQGHAALPSMVRDLRVEYVQDFNFLLSTLARLGIELKSYPSTLTSPSLLGSHALPLVIVMRSRTA